MQSLPTAEEVVAFWREAGPQRWFLRDEAFDALCGQRFLSVHEAAARGDLAEWERSAEGALALLILLDQLPRNMFRGTRQVYATDAAALALAERALDLGFDRQVEPDMRQFFYLPLMRAEDLATQERCVGLYEAAGDEFSLPWARQHRDIVRDFGRFPHRNEILGRPSTEAERAYLSGPDAFKG